MADLTTNYLGLELKNPIIIGSSGITSNVEEIIRLEQLGAGAIVLKSIFEEEIANEIHVVIEEAKKSKLIYSQFSETLDYIDVHNRKERLESYLQLIKDSKSKTTIPIIASINCITDSEWIDFANQIQNAGADALELNLSMNPLDKNQQEKEKSFLKIIKKVLKTVSIPVSIKISDRFSNLYHSLIEFGNSGIAGLVLFNKFYSIDIDLYNQSLTQGRMFSCDSEYLRPLRWIALTSEKIPCSIAASTGIHDGNTAIKMFLVGADAVQIVSTLYLNGKEYIIQMLDEIEKWMISKGIFSIKQLKGRSKYSESIDSKTFERIQYMKYYGQLGR